MSSASKFSREGGNAQYLEHLANEVYLTLEFLRRGLALGLIVREHLSAEGLAPHIECHRNGVGVSSATILESIDKKPYTALVC